MSNVVIAFGYGGSAAGDFELNCCDLYGNAGGDWIGSIAGQLGVNGNICEDPLFCDPEYGDFRLQADSPCAPYSPPNAQCELIGAWPVGCGSTATGHISWGALKVLYR